jgi:putative tricarboxylic transport membrane protein
MVRDMPSLAIGAVVLLIGAGMMWQAFAINTLPSDQLMGPRLFPVAIGAGLALLGLATLAQGLRTDATPREAGAIHDRRGVAWVLVALPVLALLVEPTGFVIAETALFALVARGFGSRSPLRDAAIGLIVALVVYAGFTFGLGLQLPAGAWFDAIKGE